VPLVNKPREKSFITAIPVALFDGEIAKSSGLVTDKQSESYSSGADRF
jgi:hypothetical protein